MAPFRDRHDGAGGGFLLRPALGGGGSNGAHLVRRYHHGNFAGDCGMGGGHHRAGAGAAHEPSLDCLPDRLPADTRRYDLPGCGFHPGAGGDQYRKQSSVFDSGVFAGRNFDFRRAFARGADGRGNEVRSAGAYFCGAARAGGSGTAQREANVAVVFAAGDRWQEKVGCVGDSGPAGVFSLRSADERGTAKGGAAISPAGRLPAELIRDSDAISFRVFRENARGGLESGDRGLPARGSGRTVL